MPEDLKSADLLHSFPDYPMRSILQPSEAFHRRDSWLRMPESVGWQGALRGFFSSRFSCKLLCFRGAPRFASRGLRDFYGQIFAVRGGGFFLLFLNRLIVGLSVFLALSLVVAWLFIFTLVFDVVCGFRWFCSQFVVAVVAFGLSAFFLLWLACFFIISVACRRVVGGDLGFCWSRIL